METFSQETIRRIRCNDPSLTTLEIFTHNGFMPSDYKGEFLLLGDALAKNTRVKKLVLDGHYLRVRTLPLEFVAAIERNSSINELQLTGCTVAEGSLACEILAGFRKKGNLLKISLTECSMGNGGDGIIASTLEKCTMIRYIGLAVGSQPSWPPGAPHGLHCGHLPRISRVFGRLQQLKTLDLSRNRIGYAGCTHLSAMLQDPNCSIITLDLGANCVNDHGAMALAQGLLRNRTLRKLYLDNNPGITDCGWRAFATALCGASTISSTYTSNHTLTSVGEYFNGGTSMLSYNISALLQLNREPDKQKVAAKKILSHHPHFSMETLFEWDIKMLPVIISWFDRATSMCSENAKSIDRRRLDAIYQYTRVMPTRFVDPPPKTSHQTQTLNLSVLMAVISFLFYVANEAVKAKWGTALSIWLLGILDAVETP